MRAAIRKHGLRNSHLLSIAPTGSVSLAFADNASAGIEPVFDLVFSRFIHAPDGHRHRFEAQDHAWRVYTSLHGSRSSRQGGSMDLPAAFVTAFGVQPQDHIAMVAAVQPYIDGAISKTVNLPASTSIDTVSDLFMQAWRQGLKGVTIFRSGGIRCAELHNFNF